jgi:hypothetical protein
MITGEQVKQAMIAAKIRKVDHHDCGVCGYMTRYLRDGEDLYFDAGCYCTYGSEPAPRSWDSAAEWINMQSQPDALLLDRGQTR